MSKDRISVMPMLRRGVETKLGVQLAGLGSSVSRVAAVGPRWHLCDNRHMDELQFLLN